MGTVSAVDDLGAQMLNGIKRLSPPPIKYSQISPLSSRKITVVFSKMLGTALLPMRSSSPDRNVSSYQRGGIITYPYERIASADTQKNRFLGFQNFNGNLYLFQTPSFSRAAATAASMVLPFTSILLFNGFHPPRRELPQPVVYPSPASECSLAEISSRIASNRIGSGGIFGGNSFPEYLRRQGVRFQYFQIAFQLHTSIGLISVRVVIPALWNIFLADLLRPSCSFLLPQPRLCPSIPPVPWETFFPTVFHASLN